VIVETFRYENPLPRFHRPDALSQALDSDFTENWRFARAVLTGLRSQEKPMWSEMAVRHREEVRDHCGSVQWVAYLTKLQLLQLLIQKCQEYELMSKTTELFWGPSAFPRAEVECS